MTAADRQAARPSVTFTNDRTTPPAEATVPTAPALASSYTTGNERRTPPAEPDEAELAPCWDSSGANTEGGRVFNRFLWCQRATFNGRVLDNKGRVIATASVGMLLAVYGRDDGDRTAKVFMRSIQGTARYKSTTTEGLELAHAARMEVFPSCVPGDAACSVGGAPAVNSFEMWSAQPRWYSWIIRSDEGGAGPDAVRFHVWNINIRILGPLPDLNQFSYAGPRIRCDTATAGFRRNRSKACVFADVIPHLQYSVDPNSPNLGVAKHIQAAQNFGQTWPITTFLKDIPGKFIDGDPLAPALHRITDDQQNRRNRRRSQAACNSEGEFATTGLPVRPAAQGLECDEYPFASTQEGAADKNGTNLNFSVLGVDGTQNGCAGNELQLYYARDRILSLRAGVPPVGEDPFYVQINDVPNNDPDACAAPDDTDPPPNGAPTVNAGPDATGHEGFAIGLVGSASDPENDPLDVHWTYSAGPDVDKGAQCRFDNPYSLTTFITCTDDGTYTVTLTAGDGHNPSVSDSAMVAIDNVRPWVAGAGPPTSDRPATAAATSAAAFQPGIVSPAPWQLFHVDRPVALATKFTDAGSNDTHTCTVNWDDGAVETFDATGYTCERDHVFHHAGMYTINVVTTDDDGGASPTGVMVVVYDPKAGVARGNGWLDAPGQGGFDFTASYPTVASTVPDGATTFALPPSAGLNLRNHQHLEWLVVTPDGKIAIKGTAEKIPGQRVGFVLYAYDGCPAGQPSGCQPGPDRLRLVVWDSTANGPIPEGIQAIYDNRAGNSFDVDQANPQGINQGTILIQHPPIQ